MKELMFRAIMKDKNATKYFTLQDLVNPKALFSIRELLIPWLLEGNQPDRSIGLWDQDGKEIYEGDTVENQAGRRCKVVWFKSQSFCGWDLKPLTGKGQPNPKYRLWSGWKIVKV